MADSTADVLNPSNTSRRSRSAARKEYDKRRDASKVYLLDVFERWRAFKEEHDITTDRNVAEFILDSYTKRTILCDAETQTVSTMSPLCTGEQSTPPMISVIPSPVFASTPADPTSRNINYIASSASSAISSAAKQYTVPSSRRRLIPDQNSSPLSLRSDQVEDLFKTLTASEGESDEEDSDTITPGNIHCPMDKDPEVSQNAASTEQEVYNAAIGGHDGEEPVDEHGGGLTSQESESKVQEVSPEEAVKSEKCIVFTDILMTLLTAVHGSICKRQECSRAIDYRKTYVGTCLVVSWRCNAGHFGGRWAAQPTCNQVRAGNLTLASSLLFSGNSYTKVGLMFTFCNLQYFSETLFYQYQSLYIAPAVNDFWEQQKKQLWSERDGKDVILSGDGRNDSPGHSAQYCTYSLADMNDNAIVQMNIVDVREAGGKSNNMERIGFERGMDKLLTSAMCIKEVVTDGHLEIAALMKRVEKYGHIVHQNDVWHGGKSITKKINAAAKSKANEELLFWAPSIRNHFWYCSKNCKSDAKSFKDMWIGILHHVVNEHEWVLEEGSNRGKCAHEQLDESERNKPWLKKESPAHKALTKIVLDKRFLNTTRYYTNFRHTGFLESFHNHILMYAPKRHFYTFVGYRMRNQLAAIDFNCHRGREVATTADGRPRMGRKFSKRTQRWYPVKILQPKPYTYITQLMGNVFKKKEISKSGVSQIIGISSDNPRTIAPNISAIPPPSVQSLVESHQSRFE